MLATGQGRALPYGRATAPSTQEGGSTSCDALRMWIISGVHPAKGSHLLGNSPVKRCNWHFIYCCRGRDMPNLRIRALSVVRLIPRLAAAPEGPPITQPESRKACRICSRSKLLSVD